MTTPLRKHCPACRQVFKERGRIGYCDHPFPGRPVEIYWVGRRSHLNGRMDLAVVRTATRAEAVDLLKAQPPRTVSSLPWRHWHLASDLNEREVRECLNVPVPLASEDRERDADRWVRNRGS